MTEEIRRLLDVQAGQDTVRIVLDYGEELELAIGSLPPEIPTDGSGLGGSISSPLLAVLRLAAERKKVARRLFSLLDRRLMPMARLRQKLLDEEYSPEAVDDVLDQVQDSGVYSGRIYAEAFCRDRLRGRPVGRRDLLQKLREKQIPAGIAAEVVAEVLDSETEAELAREAARRKWRTVRGAPDQKAQQKVARHLQSRGFSANLVWDAVRGTMPNRDNHEEGDEC